MTDRRTVKTWSRFFSREEFCRRLGIPEDEARYLLIGYVHGITGPTLAFVKRIDTNTSEQWDHTIRPNRKFCKLLGIPVDDAGSLVSIVVSWDDTVEVKFIS